MPVLAAMRQQNRVEPPWTATLSIFVARRLSRFS